MRGLVPRVCLCPGIDGVKLGENTGTPRVSNCCCGFIFCGVPTKRYECQKTCNIIKYTIIPLNFNRKMCVHVMCVHLISSFTIEILKRGRVSTLSPRNRPYFSIIFKFLVALSPSRTCCDNCFLCHLLNSSSPSCTCCECYNCFLVPSLLCN